MDDSQTVVSTKNGDDDSDSDDDDDDINVVIGDIKSGANYNMKVIKKKRSSLEDNNLNF